MWLEFTIALRFLRQGLIQTLLILVGIAVGVAVIVFVTTLINGLQDNIIGRTLGTQAHVKVEPPQEINQMLPVPAGTTQLLLEDRRAQRIRSINNWQQVRDALDRFPEITAVSPIISGPAFARRGQARKAVSLVGIDPVRYGKVIPVEQDMVAGVYRVGAGDVLVGTLLADELGLRVGSKLRLESGEGGAALVIVAGIFELGVRDLDLRYVYTDLKQAQSLLELPGGVTVIDVTVKDLFAADATSNRIVRLMGLKAESWMQSNAQLVNALRSQRMSTVMISFFVALSVTFGIASVLAISVTQRTREIGILRAMGTQRGQMLRIFLVQGALLGLAGSALGSAVGYGLVWGFNTFGPKLFFIPLPGLLVPVTMAIATLTGVLAAMVPAWRAARMDPVEAIRYV